MGLSFAEGDENVMHSQVAVRWAVGALTAVLLMLGPIGPALSDDPHALHQATEASPMAPGMAHDHGAPAAGAWEASPQGKAYAEGNHHVAGVFVLLIALSELPHALGWTMLAWTRFLLPVSLLSTGAFLMVWSDHLAWPVGPMTLAETFSGDDPEIFQHKIYGLLLLGVGTVELLRRLGLFRQAAWRIPLPALAIVGGLMLFLHSHGANPAAHKIAIHHAVMGIMAVTAGSSKLVSGWAGARNAPEAAAAPSRWELAWAVLILLIGAQLLVYSE
jgi:hypothetical protein